MYPILLNLGPLTLHTYGALAALGVFLGYWQTLALARRRGLEPALIADLTWIFLVSGLAGARLLYVAFNWRTYQTAPLDILKIWQGGLVWYGGLLLAVPVGLWWARRRHFAPKLAADLFAPGAALGHALGRMGCFLAGCCFGRACDLPWAVTFRHPDSLAPLDTPLHPSQLYEAALNFGAFFFLRGLAAKRPEILGTGKLAWIYLALYALIRLGVEMSRGDDRGPVRLGFTATQWIAALMFLVAAAVLAKPFFSRGKEI